MPYFKNDFDKYLKDDPENRYLAAEFFNYSNKPVLSELNFDRLFEIIARKHRIINLFWPKLDKEIFSEKFILNLREYRFKQKQRSLKQLSVLIKVSELLFNFNYIVLKGLPLSAYLYDDYSFRDVVDIDILVQKNDTKQIIEKLQQNSFHISEEKINSRYRHHIHASYNNISVEIHWQISPTIDFSKEFYNGLWNNKSNIIIENHRFNIPNPEYMYLIVLIHNAKHKWGQLSWILDYKRISEKIKNESSIDINKSISRFHLIEYKKTADFVTEHLFNSEYNKTLTIKERMIVEDILVKNNNFKIKNKLRNNLYFFLLNDSLGTYLKSLSFSLLRVFNRN